MLSSTVHLRVAADRASPTPQPQRGNLFGERELVVALEALRKVLPKFAENCLPRVAAGEFGRRFLPRADLLDAAAKRAADFHWGSQETPANFFLGRMSFLERATQNGGGPDNGRISHLHFLTWPEEQGRGPEREYG